LDDNSGRWKLAQFSLDPVIRYGVTIFFVGATLAVRLILWPILGHSGSFLVFFFPILFSSWLFGRGPGILAALLSAVSVEAVMLPSPGLPFPDRILHLSFLVSGLFVSLFVSAKRETEQKLRVLNSDLESRVTERTRELQKEVEQRRAGELMQRRQAPAPATYTRCHPGSQLSHCANTFLEQRSRETIWLGRK
jgi:K+-sensing histidine kinase KdpD